MNNQRLTFWLSQSQIRRPYKGQATLLISVLAGIALWVLFSAEARQRQGDPPGRPYKISRRVGELRPTGSPQLISIEPLPQSDGEMCQWTPASPPTPWLRRASSRAGMAFLQEETPPGARRDSAAAARTSVTLERPARRTIRDPFPTYSAVAVDSQNNEIVLQDENLFQIAAYDRLADTPPAAKMTEPKRVIGGPDTGIEFNCGLYVDPKTGDIYTVSNDTLQMVSVFPRSAKGNARPARQFHVPIRTYGIAVDESSQEVFLTTQSPPMVLVHRKSASGNDKPIRILTGNDTGMADPHGIGLDSRNGLIFVANYGSVANFTDGKRDGFPTRDEDIVPGSGAYQAPSITVYPIKASGNTPPLRSIAGPNTRLNWPSHLYVDEEHGEVYVANDGDDSVLVFRESDNGNAAPARVLKGPRTQIKNPAGVYVDSTNNELVVANMGNHRATVYHRTAQGDTPPVRAIRTGPEGAPALQIVNPGSVAYDTKREQILVPN